MKLKQVGALPFRTVDGGKAVEVLLVTSRRTGRWIIPKGNLDPGRDKRTMAATEAFEEAGVTGALLDRSIGEFSYEKVHSDGQVEAADVEVYALAVAEMLDDWPERQQRLRCWMSPVEASDLIEEEELAAMVLVFGTLPPETYGTC